jgi:thiamine biosynthesis protein ThiS
MKLTVNGDTHEAEPGLTISGLLQQLALGAGPVAVERNGDVVPRREHAGTELQDGDKIEIVHFVGGGSAAPANGEP